MIEPRWHQPIRRSDNIDDYDHFFIPRVHRLIKLGYDRLNPAKHATAEEPAITGDLVEAIDAVLDDPMAPLKRHGPRKSNCGWLAQQRHTLFVLKARGARLRSSMNCRIPTAPVTVAAEEEGQSRSITPCCGFVDICRCAIMAAM